MKLDLSQTTIDYAAVSGHKIYAPKGIGLCIRSRRCAAGSVTGRWWTGAWRRGGTENLPGVAAIAAVMQQLADSESRTFVLRRSSRFRDRMVNALNRRFPRSYLTRRLTTVSTTINFSVKGFPSKELLDLFDAAGIRVSSGSACGSAAQGFYVLDAMGLESGDPIGAIRMSFGPLTTESEISAACERIERSARRLCDSCLVVSSNAHSISGQQLDGLIQLKNGSMCTWLLMDSKSKRCVVIDPFEELAERVESLVRCQQSQVVAILDTHAHVDHESCRKMLLKVMATQAAESSQTNDLLGWPETPDGTATLADGTLAPYLRFPMTG